LPARNTRVQLLAFYSVGLHQAWEPECTASQTDRRTDRRTKDSRSYCSSTIG